MSTVKQDLSLGAQRKVIEDWATKAGVEIVAWFEDPARSGNTPPKRRPGLLAAMVALETLRAGVLVVAADDRLSRNTDHAGWVATEVKEAGAVVVDASKPEAEWITKMFGRMQAEAYLEALRKNTVRALALKKSRNERVGTIPFGFKLQEDKVHLEIEPDEFKALLRILELRLEGKGGRKIAAALTSEGFLPRGGSWNPGNLHVMARRWLSAELPPDLKEGLASGTTIKKICSVATTSMATEFRPLPSPSSEPAVMVHVLDPPE